METCATRICQALRIRNMKQADLAERTGIPKSAISQYCSGAFKPKQNRLFLIAQALSVDEAWLMGLDVPMERITSSRVPIPNHPQFLPMPAMKRWRVIGATACGEPMHRDLEEFVFAPDSINADLVFRCEGDSMIGAHILDGDIAFVRTCEVEDGQIAVVRVEDDYSLKRIYRGPDYLELRSENPKYPPIIIRGEQANAEIIGRVVFFITRPL